MTKTKFVHIPTGDEFKTVNVVNIALLEKDGSGTMVTLNITDDDGNFIKFKSIQTYDKLSEECAI